MSEHEDLICRRCGATLSSSTSLFDCLACNRSMCDFCKLRHRCNETNAELLASLDVSEQHSDGYCPSVDEDFASTPHPRAYYDDGELRPPE